jgi:hypothetical protein
MVILNFGFPWQDGVNVVQRPVVYFQKGVHIVPRLCCCRVVCCTPDVIEIFCISILMLFLFTALKKNSVYVFYH